MCYTFKFATLAILLIVGRNNFYHLTHFISTLEINYSKILPWCSSIARLGKLAGPIDLFNRKCDCSIRVSDLLQYT